MAAAAHGLDGRGSSGSITYVCQTCTAIGCPLAGDTNSEYLWCVDPLDGTTNFAHGYPSFAVSVAVLRHTTPVASTGAHWKRRLAGLEACGWWAVH